MSYHRGNPNRISSFFYGSGGRTDVLNYIYNPSKPPFDKGGLWQGVALPCIALQYFDICDLLYTFVFRLIDRAANHNAVAYKPQNLHIIIALPA